MFDHCHKPMKFDPTILRNRLFRGIDDNFNVTNIVIVGEVVAQLEMFRISEAALEATRLDWYLHKLRWRAKDSLLASRARHLVEHWGPPAPLSPVKLGAFLPNNDTSYRIPAPLSPIKDAEEEEETFRPPSPASSPVELQASSLNKRAEDVEERMELSLTKRAKEVEERSRVVWQALERAKEERAEKRDLRRERKRQARWLRSVNSRWQTLISRL